MNARLWPWMLGFLLLMFLMFTPSVAQEVCPEPTPPRPPMPDTPMVMPEEFRVALFDGVGQAVSELYLFEDFNGLDWEAVLDEFAPYVLQTENAWEIYALLDEMVGLLGDPLTTYISPLELEALAAQEATYGGIGALLDRSFALREGEGLRVVYVFPGSPAEEAGLKSRDRILAVDGDPCPQVERIRGPRGSEVRLLVSSPGEEPRELVIERRTIEPRIVPEVRRLEREATVGYLRLVTLSGQETLELIEEGLRLLFEEGPLSGLVIDVRGTRLGAPGVLITMLGNFVAGEVGAFYARVGETPLEVTPSAIKAGLDEIPVVVLVDDASEGEAEQLAAVLQHQGRATVVGRPTAGRTSSVRPFDFPDGSRLQLTVLGFKLPDGTRLERRGVTPDVVIDEDWADYPEAEDPYLMAALELFQGGQDEERDEQGESAP